MDIEVTFPGGQRVDAQVGMHLVQTDQPVAAGGSDEAPGPFDLFLASLATCSGYYALVFCQTRGIATEGMRLRQRVSFHPETHLPACVQLTLVLPAGFPEKYRAPLARAIEGCKVRKTLAQPPDVVISLEG